ncbi:hypothetical protein L195_g026560 [Trifolium pratense]|uniref:Uncharacterized protein n=1 Tax=Trifolium pratense TaxID=57577 RepID=A0A2K3NJL8_TRIPR|nr:hypothetical protein L195_g026560 [Trifolium pratense]
MCANEWILFESLLVFKSVEICRFLVFLVDLFRYGVQCFEVVCELRLICRLLPRACWLCRVWNVGCLRAENCLPRLSFYRCLISF